MLNGEHFPPRYCNAGVGRYRHHLKFHFIDRRWKSRAMSHDCVTSALMIAERTEEGGERIHQFAHGFARTKSAKNPGILPDPSPFFFSAFRPAGAFLTMTKSTLLIASAAPEKSTRFDSATNPYMKSSLAESRSITRFRSCFLRVLVEITSTKKREISARRFHNGGPIVSHIPSRCALGVAAFRIRISRGPRSPSSFYITARSYNRSFNSRRTRVLLSRVAVLARIISVIRIFIAGINTYTHTQTHENSFQSFNLKFKYRTFDI